MSELETFTIVAGCVSNVKLLIVNEQPFLFSFFSSLHLKIKPEQHYLPNTFCDSVPLSGWSSRDSCSSMYWKKRQMHFLASYAYALPLNVYSRCMCVFLFCLLFHRFNLVHSFIHSVQHKCPSMFYWFFFHFIRLALFNACFY